jgi:hypothetical protein
MLEFIIDLFTAKDISTYYRNIGQMVRYSDYSLTEIEAMIPYEFEIYSAILSKQLQDEKVKKNANG